MPIQYFVFKFTVFFFGNRDRNTTITCVNQFSYNVPLSNSNMEILRLENTPLFNDLGKAVNPLDIPVVTVCDFTKFQIPLPLSFDLDKISRIVPYPGAENLIHLLVFPNISPWLARGPTPGASR